MATQSVRISAFQNALIIEAYAQFCKTGQFIRIGMDQANQIAKDKGVEQSEVDSQVRQLIDLGLLRYSDSASYRAEWSCLDTFERNHPDDSVFRNNKVRRGIIDIAYDARNENSGFLSSDDVLRDKRSAAFSADELYNNAWFLGETGIIKVSLLSGGAFRYRLSDFGLATDQLRRAEELPTSPGDKVSLTTVSDVVRGWTPRHNRRLEETYKAELAEYLRSHGFPKTREEEGQSRPDILVEEIMPIELKLNPGKSELDRMSGQLLDMIDEYDFVIACVIQTKGSLDLVERIKKRFREDARVQFVIKADQATL